MILFVAAVMAMALCFVLYKKGHFGCEMPLFFVLALSAVFAGICDVSDNVKLKSAFYVFYNVISDFTLVAVIMLIFCSGWMFYRNGFNLTSVTPILFAVVISVLYILTSRYADFSSSILFSVILKFADFVLFYLGLYLITFVIRLLAYNLKDKGHDYDYILVHGARVFGTTPSLLLKKRCDKAYELYTESKGVKIIASGGQGSDEGISEARAIADYLISKGVDKGDIIKEERSTTTMENLLFSKDIAGDGHFAFVTNDYHTLRVKMLSIKASMNGQAYGAPTAWYYVTAGFIREYMAMLYLGKKYFALYSVAAIMLSVITAI